MQPDGSNLETFANTGGRPNGRLLAYDPDREETRLVLGNLYFVNGVAVSPDQS